MGSDSESAKKRAAQQLAENPNFFKDLGRKGALAPHSISTGYGSDKVGPDGLTGKERARKLAQERKKKG